MALDIAVARAVFAARKMEQALNDPGPWSMSFSGVQAPAVRWVGEDRVIFRAHFPDCCWFEQACPVIELLCDGVSIGVRPIEQPDEGEFDAEWVLALPVPVLA